MDYMPFGEIMREHNVGGTSYQYTGQEYDKESGIHNYRARLYDSDLGRFYGMPARLCHSGGDPQEQFASPFSYAGNNPVMNVDPDGEFAFVPLLVAMAKAAAIGVTANGVSNTFIQDKPFFSGAGRAAWQGALGGGLSHGIGLAAGQLGTSVAAGGAGWSELGVGAFQAGAHALSGGLQSELAGGNFGSGFLSGGISSSLGSLTAGWGDAGQLFTGIAGGGVGSMLGGGSFIDGARMGAITVGLNHIGHNVSNTLEGAIINRKIRRNGYEAIDLSGKNKKAYRSILRGFKVAKHYINGDVPELYKQFPDGFRIQDLFDMSSIPVGQNGWKLDGQNRHMLQFNNGTKVMLHATSFNIGDVDTRTNNVIKMFHNSSHWADRPIAWIHYNAYDHKYWLEAKKYIYHGPILKKINRKDF